MSFFVELFELIGIAWLVFISWKLMAIHDTIKQYFELKKNKETLDNE